MFFLNLSAGEFFALLGIVSGLVTALYFFDRSKRKKVVSTLRFWTPAFRAEQQSKRKSVREPWSLLLQLVSLALLLLALAELEWGPRAARMRNHVLMLDTSSAALQTLGSGTILDREKALARQYVSRLNSQDRVMLVLVDGLATPVTPFTADRVQLREQLNAAAGTYSALNIEHAVSYAKQAERWADGAEGEIVYIGAERHAGGAPNISGANLRVLPVIAANENCGIRAITIVQGDAANSWRATVSLANYGSEARALALQTQFAGTSFAPRRIAVRGGQETTAEYEFLTSAKGQFSARLSPGDSLAADDQASVTVPENRPTRIAVFTSRPEAWRPLLGSDTRVEVSYFLPARYQARPIDDVVILDRFNPPSRPRAPSLWVDPPENGSPLPVSATVSDQTITQWNSDAELSAGLHARDVLLSKAKVFQLFEGDFAVASTSRGPVAVVRRSSNNPKLAAVGFDFVGEPLRFRVSSPILFANLIRWLAPQAFRTLQVRAVPIGLSEAALDASERPDKAQITDDNGRAVPFTQHENRLQFYVETPTTVHVITEERERILSLVLPEIAQSQWKPPSTAAIGLPDAAGSIPAAAGLWQALALLGGFGLLVEWLLYGRARVFRTRPRAARPVTERELVSK